MSTAQTRRIYANRRWQRVRLYVLARDHYRCQIQGPHCTHAATTADHIITLEQGGDPYNLDNLRAACLPCNSGRRDRRRANPSRPW